MDIKSENVSENHKSVYTRLGRSLPEGASQFLGWRRRRGGKMKRLVFKPFRRSKAITISSASTNPASLVSSPRQRSAGRGLRRGEIANSQSDQRTITNPKRSVPPLPGPRHQWRLMRRESGAVGLWRFIKIQTRRLRGTLSKTEMRPSEDLAQILDGLFSIHGRRMTGWVGQIRSNLGKSFGFNMRLSVVYLRELLFIIKRLQQPDCRDGRKKYTNRWSYNIS